MPRNKEIYEILEEFESQKNRKEKVDLLKSYAKTVPALRDVLQGAFDKRVQWDLPVGPPPFEPNLEQSYPSTLRKQNRYFRYLVLGSRDAGNMTKIKKEQIFINILESLHPKDAEVVIKMKDKKSPAKGLTKKIVQEVYPELSIP